MIDLDIAGEVAEEIVRRGYFSYEGVAYRVLAASLTRGGRTIRAEATDVVDLAEALDAEIAASAYNDMAKFFWEEPSRGAC